MIRTIVFKTVASILLMLGALGLSMPMNAYAQSGTHHVQSAQYSGKCEKIKDKKQKKACEKAQKAGKTKKNDDGPNHESSDGANHH